MRCMNPNCRNESHQGRFIGRACYPCYELAVSISARNPKQSWCSDATFEHIADNLMEFLNQNHSAAMCISAIDEAIHYCEDVNPNDRHLVMDRIQILTKTLKGE